jgi:dolichyl-phosphate beta-glucosyltransferase
MQNAADVSRSKRVSVVVPTYREPDLPSLLQRLAATLEPLDGEIVIVDDSDDATHAALRATATPVGNVGIRVLRGTGGGKGDAIRIGILAASGNVVFYVDADIEESKLPLVPQFVALIENDHYNVVIGERRSRWEYRNFGRFLLSLGLFAAQRFFIFHSRRFFDTQFGFKAFDRASAQRIASLQSVPGGMIDIEHLYIAMKNGMRIAQIPVSPVRELRPSRLRILRCLVTDPIALLRVKWNGLRGRYES